MKIKTNKYVDFIQLSGNTYYSFNPLNREFVLVDQAISDLLKSLSSWKEKEEVLTDLSRKKYTEEIENLLSKKILIEESDQAKEELPTDFTIIGVPNDFSKMSLEVLAILKKCSKIVSLGNKYAQYLSQINPNIVDLSHVFYEEKENPCLKIAEGYAQIALTEKECVFVTENHPTIGEAIPSFIHEIAQKNKKTIRIYESLSFLDSFFAGFPFDPLNFGLTIVRTSCLGEITTISKFPLLICLIGYDVMGPKWNIVEEKEKIFVQSLTSIKSKLLGVGYSPSHECLFFSLERLIVKLPLGKLEKCRDFYVGKEISLFVPTVSNIEK